MFIIKYFYNYFTKETVIKEINEKEPNQIEYKNPWKNMPHLIGKTGKILLSYDSHDNPEKRCY